MKKLKCRNATYIPGSTTDVEIVCLLTGQACPYAGDGSKCDLDAFASLKPEAAVAEETLELINEVHGTSGRIRVSTIVKLKYLAKKYEERKSK